MQPPGQADTRVLALARGPLHVVCLREKTVAPHELDRSSCHGEFAPKPSQHHMRLRGAVLALLALATVAPGPSALPPGVLGTESSRPRLRLRGGSGGGGGGQEERSPPGAFNYESLFDGCRFGHCMIRTMNATAMEAFLREELHMQLLRKEQYQRFGRVSVKLNDADEGAGRPDDADGCVTWGVPEAQLRKGRHSAASSPWSFGKAQDPEVSAQLEAMARKLKVSAWPAAADAKHAANWTKSLYGYGRAERHFAIQVRARALASAAADSHAGRISARARSACAGPALSVALSSMCCV